MMDNAGGSETGQQILWAAGTRLLDVPLEAGDALLGEILGEIGAVVGADVTAIADFARATKRVTVHVGDASGILVDLPPVRDLPRNLIDSLEHGPAVLSAADLFGAAEVRDQVWEHASVMTALVDQDEARIRGVVFVSLTDPQWSVDHLELMRGTGLLVRQFERRRIAERHVATRRELDRLALDAATTLQGITADRFDQAIGGVLGHLLESLDARTALLIDVVGTDTIEIPFIASRTGAWAEIGRLAVPADMRRRLGVDDLGVVTGGPMIFDGVDLRADLLGDLLPSGHGQREPRTALLVPAFAGGASVTALAVVRDPEMTWTNDEIEVVSTVGAMVANTRALCLAELDSQSRFVAQETLADIGRRFVNVAAADAVAVTDDALCELAESLGADFGVVTLDDDRGVNIIRVWEGPTARAPGLMTGAEQQTLRSLPSEVTTFRLDADSDTARSWGIEATGPWTVAWVPVKRLNIALAVGMPVSSRVPSEVVADALVAFGDLCSQLQLRAAAETAAARRLELESVLTTVADDFLGGSAETQAEVELRALGRIGELLGLTGLVIHDFGDQARVGSVWRAPDAAGEGVETGSLLPESLRTVLLDSPEGAVVQLRERVSERELNTVRRRWGNDVEMVAAPAIIGGELIASVVALCPSAVSQPAAQIIRSLATMVGQFHVRVATERRDERLLRTEQLLSVVATDLAEANAETILPVVRAAFGRIGEAIGLDEFAIWRIDRDARLYRLVYAADEDDPGRRPPTSVPFGADDVLDVVEESGEWLVRVEPVPTDERRSVVAFPRSDGDTVMVARSVRPGPWHPETLDLFRSVSETVRDVESRVAADRYADAAFTNSPIGIVLRDEQLRLITCNDAFLRFVGVDDLDDVIGTMPNDFYADGIEVLDWVDEDGALSTQAAFLRTDGSRVWAQMRGSVVEGAGGDHLWLVHVEDITHRRRAEALLRFQATHDELTGLANRGRLAQDIVEIARQGVGAAVLLLDLDRFKNINDSMGHDRGDEMLVAIADRLRLAVRPGDLVARLGGDEFAVVLPGPVTVTDAEMVADRLLRLISEPMWIGPQTVYPTASIGIAISEDPELADLLRRADTAMYRAKDQGRAQHASFDDELEREVTDRMATEAGLRGALRNDQFVVHYQPEVSTIDETMLGAEALVRWNHPELGLLAAGSFIEVAEETGLLIELGEFVLREAVAEAMSWPGANDGPVIRVNLAAAQLQREETVALVRSVLDESGLPAHRLCLEITESAVMNDIERSEQILARLKELGVVLAVDDFGTGFSSLAYLKRFPVDALKIDRAFVMGLGEDDDDLAFVRSIISLADALGLEVVAEGVETQLQARTLAGLGCHRAQGYLYAKPGPPEALRAHLAV